MNLVRAGDYLPRKKELVLLGKLAYQILGSSFTSSQLELYYERLMKFFATKEKADIQVFRPDYQTHSLSEVITLRQVMGLFEKNRSFSVSPQQREEAAFKKWLEAEALCAQTNIKFGVSPAEVSGSFEPDEAHLIQRVRRKITHILGRAPSLDTLDFRFGPGASVGVSRLTSVRRKLAVTPTVSTNAFIHVKWMAAAHPHWSMDKVHISRGRLQFVPKSAWVDRSIIIEPIVNTYLQLGVGSYLKDRLRLFGCNLNSQQTNRDLARFGSLTGLVSTIDLSSASDTIARNVVSELLPPDWFALLDSMITRSVEYRDVTYSQQKFSSMGNGFTFELESLIFFAIASEVCKGSRFVNVFGDDIIIPTRFYEPMMKALELFGFIPNNDKSFSSGPFRESCGKDFLNGVDVRPCYIKDHLMYLDLFRLHNFFWRSCRYDIASFILSYIPTHLRIFGPDGYGDGHLLGDWTPIYRKTKERGWSGCYFRTWKKTTLKRTDETAGDFPAVLYSISKHQGFWYEETGESLNPSLLRERIDESSVSNSLYSERGGNRFVKGYVYTMTTS